jgi:hypothetical protein
MHACIHTLKKVARNINNRFKWSCKVLSTIELQLSDYDNNTPSTQQSYAQTHTYVRLQVDLPLNWRQFQLVRCPPESFRLLDTCSQKTSLALSGSMAKVRACMHACMYVCVCVCVCIKLQGSQAEPCISMCVYVSVCFKVPYGKAEASICTHTQTYIHTYQST